VHSIGGAETFYILFCSVTLWARVRVKVMVRVLGYMIKRQYIIVTFYTVLGYTCGEFYTVRRMEFQ